MTTIIYCMIFLLSFPWIVKASGEAARSDSFVKELHNATAIAVNKTRKQCVLGYKEGTIKVFDATTTMPIKIYTFHKTPIVSIQTCSNGNIMSADIQGKIGCYNWDSKTFNKLDLKQILKATDNAVDPATYIYICPYNDDLMITGHKSGLILVWNFETGSCIVSKKMHISPIRFIAMLSDNRFIAVSAEGTITVHGLENSTQEHQCKRYKIPTRIEGVCVDMNDSHKLFLVSKEGAKLDVMKFDLESCMLERNKTVDKEVASL